MKSIRSELSFDVLTVASLACNLGPRRPSIPELFAVDGDRVIFRAFTELLGNGPFVRVALVAGGPVERMNSAKSCSDSRGTLASLA